MQAQSSIRLEPTAKEIPLDGHLGWLADPEAVLTLDDVREADFSATAPVLTRAQMQPEAFWLRLTLQAPDGPPTAWALETAAERMEMHWADGDGIVQTRVAGIDVPKAERAVDQGYPATVLLTLDGGEVRTLWARVLHDPDGSEATPTLQVLRLKPAAVASHDSRSLGITTGLFFGFLLALVLYTLSLYAGFRDPAFLYYGMYVAGVGLFFATTYRLLFDAFWPATATWSPLLQTLAAHAGPAGYALFIRSFLGPARLGRTLDRLLLASAALMGVGLIVTALGGWLAGSYWSSALILALCGLSLVAMVRAWRAGFAPAGLLLIAFGVLAASTVGFLGPRFGLPRVEWAMEMVQAGIAFEALLMALALSMRVRGLRSEQVEAIEATRQVQESNVALRDALRLRSSLLGFAAHDLRSPLANVLGYAGIIQREATDPAQVTRCGRSIETSATRLLRLIDDLLVTAALDGGHVHVETVPTDLGALVERALGPFALLAEAKEQHLALRVGPDCWARLDPDRFHEVVDNLLSNAVKYTPAGGAIEVEVRATPEEVWLTVGDSGPGITQADRARLFQPFVRLSASPTGDEPSTGLGLSIAKKIVDLHGGRIEVESAPGDGARFSVVVPASAAPPADCAESSVEAEVGQ